jgi:hypothetical protein
MRLSISILLLATSLFGCGGQANAPTSLDADIQRQIEEYDAQSKIVERQLQKSHEQAARYDALLDRWEAQADRQDKLLDQLEAKVEAE